MAAPWRYIGYGLSNIIRNSKISQYICTGNPVQIFILLKRWHTAQIDSLFLEAADRW